MAGLNKGKHIITEIDSISCSVVETGVNKDRLEFLKTLLEYNKYEVKVITEELKEGKTETTYTVAVTDIIFNPVVDVYKRRLKSLTGHIVTPAYWLQKSVAETEAEVNYWNLKY